MCYFRKLFAVFKMYKIKRQYETVHREKIEKDNPLESRDQEERFEELKKQLNTQQSLLIIVKGSSCTTDASFAVAQIIRKHEAFW